MKYFLLFLFFFTSCQNKEDYLLDWWSSLKENTVTYFASQSSAAYLTEAERFDLLDLFADLQEADSCDERQDLIEGNRTLNAFGKQYNLLRGYLFDVLFNYDYEKALMDLDRTTEERIAITVLNTWKISASIEQINQVIEEISKCYPNEYVD